MLLLFILVLFLLISFTTTDLTKFTAQDLAFVHHFAEDATFVHTTDKENNTELGSCLMTKIRNNETEVALKNKTYSASNDDKELYVHSYKTTIANEIKTSDRSGHKNGVYTHSNETRISLNSNERTA